MKGNIDYSHIEEAQTYKEADAKADSMNPNSTSILALALVIGLAFLSAYACQYCINKGWCKEKDKEKETPQKPKETDKKG